MFAAASLTETFSALGKQFEAAHPGVTVKFNYLGSTAAGREHHQGAPADVFASADAKNMKLVTDARTPTARPPRSPRTRCRSRSRRQPENIKSLATSSRAASRSPSARRRSRVAPPPRPPSTRPASGSPPRTLEQDVKAAQTKLTLGEVDAALVYRTDVKAVGGKAVGLDFPESAQAVNTYPIVPPAKAPNADAAKAFVAFVLSEPAARP